MKLFVLTALAMIAFAANSVLNRLALTGDEAGPAAFAAVRVAAGALVLWALVRWRSGDFPDLKTARWPMALALLTYMLGFSFAYVALPSGAGALVLFGTVQVTMFAGGVLGGERVPPLRWLGAGVALAGLGYLLWPGGMALRLPIGAVALMVAAGIGWGIYSLLGRGAKAPLALSGLNFALALLPCAALWLVLRDALSLSATLAALTSGAVTSGLGYALWYAILPQLGASRAAVAQLTVPVIAVLGGVLLLGEALSLRLVLACALVLGGVGLSLVKR
ncbi:EamA-like transporter family protein [Aquimixticola soesokkakensis]|uniref:EamA-like transporter family protein n=1 Tax=Aquimixticola soesokkakensis TaxID=1519096 RepID=A0A1Y5RM11_9RHOB|nr:DMT family transporter [Aquimixticola soesokkakensis]SLN20601.1 EamA-like transporter family protein [Aquimixticola soesokkakensis]